MADNLDSLAILAWIGEDELGIGRIGIKQASCPAGYVPLAAMEFDQHKLERLRGVMEIQAAMYGKRIRLVRFRFEAVLEETASGQ